MRFKSGDELNVVAGKMITAKNGIIKSEKREKPDPIEELRKLALTLCPKHGDKLYPLEVLGVYHIVNRNPTKWDFGFGGNPDQFVDDQINDWLSTCEIDKFKNRLERTLVLDQIVQKIFLLRLNYALLLEEGKDEIKIHRGRVSDFEWYSDGSPIELMKDAAALDALAGAFYSYEEVLSSIKTGTKLSTKQKIVTRLVQFGYKLDMDLDSVYRELNKSNAKCLEEGLIARIAYVAFESEGDTNYKRIQ